MTKSELENGQSVHTAEKYGRLRELPGTLLLIPSSLSNTQLKKEMDRQISNILH